MGDISPTVNTLLGKFPPYVICYFLHGALDLFADSSDVRHGGYIARPRHMMGLSKYPPSAIDGGGYFPHGDRAMTTLPDDIKAFCQTHGLSISRFGVLALNDKNFVPQLLEGRRVWPDTEARARKFMSTYRPEAA